MRWPLTRTTGASTLKSPDNWACFPLDDAVNGDPMAQGTTVTILPCGAMTADLRFIQSPGHTPDKWPAADEAHA